jgi:DNA-binding CsgD family transcriptional regulator
MCRTSPQVHIRQLCSLGVSGRTIMPAVLAALKSWVPYSIGAFFWTDARGQIVSACASEPGQLALAGRFAVDFARRPSCSPAWPGITELVARQRPSVIDLTPYRDSLRDSAVFHDLLAPLGATVPLVAVVTGETTSGLLVLLRSGHDRLFGREDVRRLRDLLPDLTNTLTAAESSDARVAIGDGGILVAGPGGQLIHACVRGRELLHLAAAPDRLHLGRLIEPETELLRTLTEALSADNAPIVRRRPVQTVDNPWGRFEFMVAPLAGSPGHAGIQVQRLVPVSVKMAESANTLPLSPRQRELAVLLGSSLQNDTIADRLGLRPSTVAGMVKDVYHRIGVNSRHALRELLLAPV